ncbi:SHOCT domain-containing protein [Primorskyibacter sp. 2E107]|uniref:SHOCT domain-containing protein n=1 Tax=Primorskyibacter sp. 2E107 TaxID=3403458 RepID=UPI003AF8AB50
MKHLVLAMVLVAGPALADRGDGYGYMMDGYGYGMSMMFGPILWLIVLGLVVAGVIWFVRRSDTSPAQKSGDAMAELDMRLARGDIDAEDYAARKKLLAG